MVPWSVLPRALRHTCSGVPGGGVYTSLPLQYRFNYYFVFMTRSDIFKRLAVVQLVKFLAF
jgi:hypothetical protein